VKKIILSVLFTISAASAQCEESFGGKSLEELIIMHESQKNAIKNTVEYKYVQSIGHEAKVYLRLAKERETGCYIAIDKNMFWPWAASEDVCELVLLYLEMADEKTKACRDATDRLRESIAEDYPTFDRLGVVISERKLAIAQKRRALILAKSGQ
jgi:hypothetical protein